MPDLPFRGDPYRVLDVSPSSTDSAIKRRWRELAREHHPDRAAGDREEATRLTVRMARINAAYDLLRDPARRARFDASADRRRAYARGGTAGEPGRFDDDGQPIWQAGPPPPPRTPPVTARFDTTAAFRPRNTVLYGGSAPPTGQPPIARPRPDHEELRASTPSGPVHRQAGREPLMPTLRDARETVLEFGKFGGYTLGEVALLEPTYIDWLAQTITRDDELVRRARVVQADLDRHGVVRRVRPPTPGWGSRSTD